MSRDLEHPQITRTLRYGAPDWEGHPYEVALCPCCEEETELLYRNPLGEIVGCEHCLTTLDAMDWLTEGV